MKKIVFILASCLFLAAQLSAQDADGSKFRFGVQASPTWSWLKSDVTYLENAGSNWGLKLSFMVEKYFQPNFALTSGIGFGFNHGGTLQSGYSKYRPWLGSDLSIDLNETDSLSLPEKSKLHYRIRYVEVPLGAKILFGSGEDSNLQFYAEPVITLGFVAQAFGDIRGAGAKFDTNDQNIRSDVRGLALSWGFGAGVEYAVSSRTSLIGGFFFQNQFTDITQKSRARIKDNSEWIDEKAKVSFRSVTLRLGVVTN
jgi:opacity protein-like surface antigen